MDGWKLIASYYIKEKFENKGSQMGNTKKIFKKKISYLVFLFFIYFT
jgi:bacteriorhodopsin